MVPKCNPSVLTGKKQREIWEPRAEEGCVDAMQPALWMEERAKEPKESIFAFFSPKFFDVDHLKNLY